MFYGQILVLIIRASMEIVVRFSTGSTNINQREVCIDPYNVLPGHTYNILIIYNIDESLAENDRLV